MSLKRPPFRHRPPLFWPDQVAPDLLTAVVIASSRENSGWPPIQAVDRPSRAFVALFGAMALLAGICGVLLIATDGLGMDRGELRDSPFRSFWIPGLLLTFAVGGSQLGATVALLKRHPGARWTGLCAGIVLLGWIGFEALMISSGRGLQAFIALYAVAEILMARPLQRSARVPS